MTRLSLCLDLCRSDAGGEFRYGDGSRRQEGETKKHCYFDSFGSELADV